MTDTTAAQQQAVQHPSKGQFDRLVAYVQELVADHSRLEARIEQLEAWEEQRRRVEDERTSRQQKRQAERNVGFQGRDAALEADAGS